MRKLSATAMFFFCLCVPLFGGCGWFGGSQSKSTGGVAVIDLDEIARQVGASEEMSQALIAHEAALNTQLQSLKTSYVQQLQAKKEELGGEPTTEDNQRLAALSQQATVNLASAQQQAKGHLTKRRAALVVEFRKRVAPIAKQIATERGLTLVIPRNEGMILAVDDQVDITSAVATALKPQWQALVPAASPSASTPQMALEQPASDVQPASHTTP